MHILLQEEWQMRDNRKWIFDTLQGAMGPVPFNFSFSPPALTAIERHYQTGSIEDTFDFPIRMSGPVSIKPLYADPAVFGDKAVDEFGVVWSTSRIDRGQPVEHCLKQNSLKGYRFPDAAEEYRFAELGAWCQANGRHFTVLWVGDLWERAVFMRGMENLLLDLYEAPLFVHGLMRGIADYILETMRLLLERFPFDCIAVSDDYGAQRSPLMSPRDWRVFIKPYLGEIYSAARHNGKVVFHHSCGNIFPIIGDMIDLGLQILHPIQPEAMDSAQLKREFGRSLTFCGGIGTQKLLPFGTPGEVRGEVFRLKALMGEGGRYILEPGITVQADVPVENIAAMLEEAANQNK
jgi:uroporphyrinogen decarboxylase